MFATAVALALVACGASGDDADDAHGEGASRADESRRSGSAPTAVGESAGEATGDLAGAHDCVPPDGGGARIAWEALRNPIVTLDTMAKDQAVRFAGGRWHIWFSNRGETDDEFRLVHAVSDDWAAWDLAEPVVPGGASPDVTRRSDGRFVMAHQVPSPDDSSRHRLVYRVADDADALTAATAQPLFPDLFPTERVIDGALAHTDSGAFAMFKRGRRDAAVQIPTLVHSPSGSLDGPWVHVGDPDVGLLENYQFLTVDGVWHLVGTTIPVHAPALYRLDGDAAEPAAWLRWTSLGEMSVPEEDWNGGGAVAGLDYERANSAYLCDARAVDGHFYLFYAGSTELTSHAGRGHASIGVARSVDLVTWSVPTG